MEICLIADAASVASSHGLGLAIRSNFPTSNLHFSPSSDSCPAHGGALQIFAGIFPVDAVAPPSTKTRTRLRRKRAAKRKSFGGGNSNGSGDGIEDWFFGGDGPIFGGGGGGEGFGSGGGGGGGWNFGGFGEQSWNESSSSPSDPAFDFVYEVISWIALSNCVHFAFKKVLRVAAGGDAEREKVVPMRLTSVC